MPKQSKSVDNQPTITGKALVSLVIGSLVTGLVGGAFTYARIANTDHFLLKSLSSEVEAIPKKYLPVERYEYEQQTFYEFKNEQKDTNKKVLQDLQDIKINLGIKSTH